MYEDVAAIILAGGLGKRFGFYKPLYPYKGRTLLENILSNLDGLDIYISVRYTWQEEEIKRNIRDFTVDFIYDTQDCIYGPICGVVSAINNLIGRYKRIFIISSDLIISKDLVRMMLSLHEQNVDATLAYYNGYIEPVPSIFNLDVLKPLKTFVESNLKPFRLTDLIRVCRNAKLLLFKSRPILNVNYVEDVESAIELDEQIDYKKFSYKYEKMPGDYYLMFMNLLLDKRFREACHYLKKELDEYNLLRFENLINHVQMDFDTICTEK